LLEASPKTGRLHQIRVHLAHLGHPIAGDAKYSDKRLSSPPGLTRQFLHAQELKIALLDGQEKIFQAPLPTELSNLLETLPLE
jgi:23S rRNA-/tRNA-specific pseudouridylate synthase